jgi:hypothetical protein
VLNGIDHAIIAFGQQIVYLIPYANVCIGGYPIGEWVWIIVIISCIGELIVLYLKRKVA